jgi:hypothetical protein
MKDTDLKLSLNSSRDYILEHSIKSLQEAEVYAKVYSLLLEEEQLDEISRAAIKNALKAGGTALIMALAPALASGQTETGSFELIKMLQSKFGTDELIDVADIIKKDFKDLEKVIQKRQGRENIEVKVDPKTIDSPAEWNATSTDMQKAIWRAYVQKGIERGIMTDKPVDGETVFKVKYDFTSGKPSKALGPAKFQVMTGPGKFVQKVVKDNLTDFQKAFAKASEEGLDNFTFEGEEYEVKYATENPSKKPTENDLKKGYIEFVHIPGDTTFKKVQEYA